MSTIQMQRPKQTRKSTPKTRTGCKTCRNVHTQAANDGDAVLCCQYVQLLTAYRVRRIKCDESRPHCLKYADVLFVIEKMLTVMVTDAPAQGANVTDIH